MAKVQVTSQLAELIKTIRIQNSILSKDLAAYLKKSPAYISKLESGEIQSLDRDMLFDVLEYITKGNSSFDEIIEEVFATLKFKYTREEIENQLWFENFDTVERLIPIPEELVDEFNNQIKELNITRSHLLARINGNESIEDSIRNDSTYPKNEWFHINESTPKKRFIIIDLSDKSLNDILDKKVTKSVYIFILAIQFNLLKIKKYGDSKDIDDSSVQDTMIGAIDTLNKFKFYSLSEKDKLINKAETPEEYDRILNTFDRQNQEVINEILGGYSFWSERDIKFANYQFNLYLKNMKWDLGFMMKLMSLEFNSLSEVNYTNKKSLMNEISALISKYQEISENDNVEIY